jgi:hypothetical protein
MTTTIVTNGDYVIDTGSNHQLSVIGNITTTGYIFGNGSQLVGVSGNGGGGTAIALVNGVTNLTTQPSGIANLSIGLASNVVIWQTTGEYVTGVVSATGNVTGNFFIGNGSQLTGLPVAYGNANVVANLAALGSNPVSTTGNIAGGNLSAVGGVYTAGVVSAAGNVRGSNINTVGVITATGNITGNVFIGNGSQLTGMYGNANLADLGTNPVSTTGNISGSFFIGNGSQLTGLPANYGNANVVANLAALGTNPVSTTGNISGSFFIGNGSQLSGLPATYGNANVVANLAALGSNPVSTTGNITSGYLFGNASQLTNVPRTRSVANVTTSLLAANAVANVSATGFKGYNLYSIQVDNAAWVTVYSSTAARTNDASRPQSTPPTAGSGVIAEIISTGPVTQLITPGAVGFSSESPPTTVVPMKVVNNGGSSVAITVSLNLLQTES